MKKSYLLIACFVLSNAGAQIINFPDPDFKALLLGNPSACAFNGSSAMTVDVDGNGEIEQSEALAVTSIVINNNAAINDLTGIEYFTNMSGLTVTYTSCTTLPALTLTNLRNVHCNDNSITSLDFSNAMQLETVICDSNQLTSLLMPDAETIWKLTCAGNHLTSLAVNFYGDPAGPSHFNCSNNNISDLDIGGSFYSIDVNYNNLTVLDLSRCYYFLTGYGVSCYGNNNLAYINLKNGFNDLEQNLSLTLSDFPNLHSICIDDLEETSMMNLLEMQNSSVNINSYCTFVPDGNFTMISGTARLSTDGSCTETDQVATNVKINLYDMDNGISWTYLTDANGQYHIPVVSTTLMFSPTVLQPENFTIDPEFTFISIFNDPTYVQNVCLTANGTHDDVSVSILPITEVRPGIPAQYRIILENNGSQSASGTATFNYDDALTDFSNATVIPDAQSVGQLTWNYSDLLPLQTRTIDVVLNVHTPMSVPPVDAGTLLSSSATITAANDEDPDNNTMALNEVVVNSLDPNDKVCLEGATIAPERVGEYVHYMIRFENTGTANAINVVVADNIDTDKFVLESLQSLGASHPCVTRIVGSRVEFIFENINLPFDDANNDGYVAFKIKTNPDLVLGDTFSNAAKIFFDFNFPIATEPAVTTVSLLKTSDFETANGFRIYPNPAGDVLNLQSNRNMHAVSIYNALGQLVLANGLKNQLERIDVSGLRSGNYFIKVQTDDGVGHAQFLKK
ncbi:T9SS type A sorting domain-containing protein [Flavobacterium sp.]|uniref:DUF7619 domain-containing protein n=1 Tax=Flavobacterium sp. TaxID=239 RepID=UPI0039E55D26